MPGKPRQKKSKHPHHSRKSKAIQRQASEGLRQTPEPKPKPAPTVPSPQATVPKVESIPVPSKLISHPFIAGELRRIGILAGIIIIILIILSIVIS